MSQTFKHLLFGIDKYYIKWGVDEKHKYIVVSESDNDDPVDGDIKFDIVTGKQIFEGKYSDIPENILEGIIKMINLSYNKLGITTTFYMSTIFKINAYIDQVNPEWEKLSLDTKAPEKLIVRKKAGRKKKEQSNE